MFSIITAWQSDFSLLTASSTQSEPGQGRVSMAALNMLIFYLSLLSQSARELSQNRTKQAEADIANKVADAGDEKMGEYYLSFLLSLNQARFGGEAGASENVTVGEDLDLITIGEVSTQITIQNLGAFIQNIFPDCS